MKKVFGVLTSTLALALALVPVASVHAAPRTTAKSTAQFTVNPGGISLDKVPDLNFNSVRVEDLITGPQSLSLKDGKVTRLDDAGDGQNDQTIQVTDMRGTNEGWSLAAQLGSFVYSSSQSDLASTVNAPELNVTGLSFTDVTVGSNGTAANSFLSNSITGTGAAVWTADDGSAATPASTNFGTGANTAKVNKATLALTASPNAKAGVYRAPITWTLTAGPTGAATSSNTSSTTTPK